MKREYVKPTIYFESFALSTNIAGDCEYTSNATKGSCGYELRGGLVVFADSEMGCSVTSGVTGTDLDTYENDSICYHVPTDDKELFNS